MKKLKKILLINWLYFSKQLIEVGDVNFLTGKNGAGKSTVIDALQIVLLGETNAHNFNQAANEKSQRTLDGYLRADMDKNSPYSRRGKDFSSYIACEFQDETEGTQFVTGVVFDCRNDGVNQEHFFIYDGTIPEHGFLVGREAMDTPSLRTFLRQQYGARAKLYDTQKQYRTDMLAKWNVHSEQVSRMLKKAVSFRPIVDIQKFITENICDIPDKPDIEAMQQNIRDYKRHEQLAQRQEEKLEKLREIARLFQEMQAALDRWEQQSFLVLWAEKEDLEGWIAQKQNEEKDCRAGVEREENSFQQTAGQIEEKQRRQEELTAACAQSDVVREENRLNAEKRALLKEQKGLLSQVQSTVLEIKREANLLCSLGQKISGWEEDPLLTFARTAAEELQQVYEGLCGCDDQVFTQSLDVFERAQETASKFMAAVRETAYKVEEMLQQLNGEQNRRRAALTNLHRNVKDYPKELRQLRDRLSVELKRHAGREVGVDILADVLEIAEGEEHWRRAVEGYLNTQKFYLLIEPEHYQKALAFYDEIKGDYSGRSLGLVDIAKLRERENIKPCGDSLAQKIETDNELARTYIDYLLGRVVCCAHASQLRWHKTALTADGIVRGQDI